MWLDVPVHDALGMTVVQSLLDHRVNERALQRREVKARTLRSSNM